MDSAKTTETSSQEQALEKNDRQNRVSIRDRIGHFTWTWFSATMSTGAIGTLLAQQPFGFTGLLTIGKIFFVLDLVLFVLFTALITTRFCMKRGALTLSLHHPQESFYFGTFWVSIALILYCIQEYGVPACGPWLVKTLEVCYWTYAALALLVVIFQYHVIFDVEQLPIENAMPTWILPAYPFLILGPLASVLEHSQPQEAALPILIGGIVFQGLGWCMAFFMYSLYFMRLISKSLPDEPKRPGMYVAVGPAAYTSITLVALGTQAQHVLPPTYLNITSVPTGDLWKAFGVPTGIFLWLLAFWFFAQATVSVVRGWNKMAYSNSWWAFIFPNVGLTVAAIQIGDVLESDGIKGVTSAMSVALVAVWMCVAVMCVRAVWRGDIAWPGKDEDAGSAHTGVEEKEE